MSRRFTERPLAYSTLDDLQRGLLHQVRRFRRALCETAARGPILLNPDTPDKPPRKLPKPGDDRMANLELFHDQIVLLKNMSAQIVVNFSDIPKARNVKKTVDDLIADIEAKADVLRRQMADEAKGTVENTVITRNRALIRELQTDLGKSVSEIRETYLVGKITPPHIDAQVDADVAYAVLDDLLGPDGYRHPKYFVVTAYPIQKGVAGHNIAPMYVTVTPEFRTPNRLQWAAAPKTPQELRVLAKDCSYVMALSVRLFRETSPFRRIRLSLLTITSRRPLLEAIRLKFTLRMRSALMKLWWSYGASWPVLFIR